MRGSSEQHGGSKQRQSLRGSPERTSATGRLSPERVDTTDAGATSSSAAGDYTDGGHSTTRGNEVRGDAAKGFARAVRDGSTSEGRRLRRNLWVRSQEEKEPDLVPRQVLSWLTGRKIQQRKASLIRRHHSSQTDLVEILHAPHRMRVGTRRPRLDGTKWKTS